MRKLFRRVQETLFKEVKCKLGTEGQVAVIQETMYTMAWCGKRPRQLRVSQCGWNGLKKVNGRDETRDGQKSDYEGLVCSPWQEFGILSQVQWEALESFQSGERYCPIYV